MRTLRFRLAAVALIAALGLSCLALAQGPKANDDGSFAQPPEKLPKVPRGQDIEFLFGALKAAPSAEAAKAVEGRIWAIWMVSPSDTASLLMSRVRQAVAAQIVLSSGLPRLPLARGERGCFIPGNVVGTTRCRE